MISWIAEGLPGTAASEAWRSEYTVQYHACVYPEGPL